MFNMFTIMYIVTRVLPLTCLKYPVQNFLTTIFSHYLSHQILLSFGEILTTISPKISGLGNFMLQFALCHPFGKILVRNW